MLEYCDGSFALRRVYKGAESRKDLNRVQQRVVGLYVPPPEMLMVIVFLSGRVTWLVQRNDLAGSSHCIEHDLGIRPQLDFVSSFYDRCRLYLSRRHHSERRHRQQ